MLKIIERIFIFFILTIAITSCQDKFEADALSTPLTDELKIGKLNFNVKICKWKNDFGSAISFTWDDNNWTVNKCSEIFEKYDYRCTFFINPGCYMSNVLIQDYQRANKKGFEIGNHGYSHGRLDQMGIDDLIKEIVYSKNMIPQIYSSCFSFAYPFHLSSPLADSIIKQNHPFCRNFIKKNKDVFAWANDRDNTYSSRVNAIKESQLNKDWIIFGGHGLDDNGYNPIPSFELDSLLKFVSTQNIWVDKFSEVCKYYLTYHNSKIEYSTNSITINNNNYTKQLEQFQIRDCILTLSVESAKGLIFSGSNIIDIDNYRLQNGLFKYLINIDIMKGNTIKYINTGTQF